MSSTRKSLRHHGTQGMTESMASQLNRHQALKVAHKMTGKKIHSPKPKQGYTPQRSSVDTSTL